MQMNGFQCMQDSIRKLNFSEDKQVPNEQVAKRIMENIGLVVRMSVSGYRG